MATVDQLREWKDRQEKWFAWRASYLNGLSLTDKAFNFLDVAIKGAEAVGGNARLNVLDKAYNRALQAANRDDYDTALREMRAIGDSTGYVSSLPSAETEVKESAVEVKVAVTEAVKQATDTSKTVITIALVGLGLIVAWKVLK